eukprot:IDg17571t1
MPQTNFRYAKACRNASAIEKGQGRITMFGGISKIGLAISHLGFGSAVFETCTTLALELSWCTYSTFGIHADFAPKLHAVESEVLSARRAGRLFQGLLRPTVQVQLVVHLKPALENASAETM